ncbi:MAG: hypothetical protein OXH54_05860 [Acidimicrobiaceae bacterium]|nr:hypothetical protein [Acidimicrobiaceae bacterium]
MTKTFTRPARSLKQALARQLPKRRDDSGLTTLEWLLIVAAVAGLAALAVVLVTNVVGDTSEQISGSSARRVAAEVAASAVVEAAKTADVADTDHDTWAEWDNYFTTRCERVRITFSDAVTGVTATFVPATGGAAAYTAVNLLTGDAAAATATKPQVICTVV